MEKKRRGKSIKRIKSEADVLKALDIPDFRHMSKDKVMSFCGMVDKMDPEVAKAAIAQFPEFAKTVGAALADYVGFAHEMLEKDAKSADRFFAICDAQNKALSAMLEKGDLTTDEKYAVIEQMAAIRKMVCEKDSENKKHTVQIGELVSRTVLAALCIMLVAVGGRANISPAVLRH